MSLGMTPKGANDKRRWDRALQRAEGVVDLGLGPALRRYYTVVAPLVVLASVALGALISMVWPSLFDGQVHTFLLSSLVLFIITAVAVGMIYSARRLTPLVPPHVAVTTGLTLDVNKKLRRQVLGRIPFTRDEALVVHATAVEFRLSTARQLVFQMITPLLSLVSVVMVGSALLLKIVGGLGIVVLAVGFMVLARQFRQAGIVMVEAQEPLKVESGRAEP